jgi:isopentenyldiphosphate isomerase
MIKWLIILSYICGGMNLNELNELWDILDENRNKTGRLHERGKQLQKDEYHLVVHVWIVNDKNEFLISKRTPNKPSYPNMWECTGGSAIAGDDSLTTAIKEVGEELGVILEPQNGFLFKQYQCCCDDCGGSALVDIWVFRQNVDITSVVLQANETCDAMWATKEQIDRMIEEKTFIGREVFFYIDELQSIAFA